MGTREPAMPVVRQEWMEEQPAVKGALGWAVPMGGQGQLHNKCFVLAPRASSPMVGIRVPARSWGWGRVIAPFSSQQCHTTGRVLWGH